MDIEMCVPLFIEGVDARGYDTSKHKILVQRGTSTCIIPPILNKGPLCKGTTKCCCFEERIACPCDSEVPCMFGCCFVICFKDFKFELEVFKTKAPNVAFGGSPDVQSMER